MDNAFDGFLQQFSAALEEQGLRNHRPQTSDLTAHYADLIVTALEGRKFYPKIVLHLERRSFAAEDAADFRRFAQRHDAPHGGAWLYLRLAEGKWLGHLARRLAIYVRYRWIGQRHHPRLLAMALEHDRWSRLDLTAIAKAAQPDSTEQTVRESDVRAILSKPSPTGPDYSQALEGQVVEINSSGCWIKAGGERYWAFRGAFRDDNAVRMLFETYPRTSGFYRLPLRFVPIAVAGTKYATLVIAA